MGHVESRVNQQGPPCKAKYSWVTDSEGSRSASETMGDKLHRQEGNNPDHQLRPVNDRSVIKEMNGAKRSAEAVGCKNTSVGERSALERSLCVSSSGQSGSENVGLSNANIGENPMPPKPKGSSAKFPKDGYRFKNVRCPCFFRVRRGRENASSRCSSTRRYDAEVTHAILPGKARTTFKQKGTCTRNRHRWVGLRKVVRPCMGAYAYPVPEGQGSSEIPCRNSNLVSGPTGQGTVSGRQFLWGVGLPKGNRGMQRFPRAGRRLALECKGRRELDCKTHPSSRDESRP
ncbi:hypothetical protein SASPL_115364 [Salvia splendens]|uniref:Uncharacterized protein n=1 Tax=Salvia splendens TaxID=180675 RepID=A0A8X8Y2C3_SALSN|nr:hypothetical protein SASPL_115364 [Salvia splendens]